MTESPEAATPPPLPRPTVPTGLKVMAWIGLAAGAWNALGVGILFTTALKDSDDFGDLIMPVPVRIIWVIVAVFLAMASLAVLTRRTWGRKAFVLAVIGVCGGMAAWYVQMPIRGWAKGMFIVPFIAMAAVSVGLLALALWALLRYLRKPHVRAAFGE
jgi:lipopolysaccharide export LptBFGC system permease protein LptF